MTKWTIESLKIEANKYTYRVDFQKGSARAYDFAHDKGLLDQICGHMVPSRSKPNTFENLRKSALKYKSRGDFKKGDEAMYQCAWKRGILNQICGHMKPRSNEPYTFEELHHEALKYKRRGDFFEGSSSAYSAAHRKGILNDICTHMKASGGTSGPERELFSIIESVCPTATKMRDMKVSIYNKPFIKGFDIDIYVPEVKKGVEFDGTYHHSFKYMRSDKGKTKWSDEDILNYHKLKDDWFATKGIDIIHIKEEEWKKDRESCIQRCLNFLGVCSE